MSGRDRGYGRDYLQYGAPFAGWYPGGFWAGAPMYGWGGWGGGFGWPMYPVPLGYGGYDYGFRERTPPEESPAYGRGGDEAARRWAKRYGYDVEYTIRPRGPRPSSGRYDRPFRSGGR
jgi:hypothetical protein